MASASTPPSVSLSSSPPPQPSLSTNASSKSLVHSVSQKLHAKNYLLWIQQVEPVIHSHHLEGYIVNPQIPQKYASIEDQDANQVTNEYGVWYEQDLFLLAWL
ncbi:hypothetical protein D0Y65_041808 [Glycine soja]|uniref:Retrotransposon Copia-like N-terminal domain-containing protein n=1 Tax=Glycine soja TaxID=3848 RepID=A0A445GXB9_GLYSO|nr:hypothetical protein D0Y65_041808 [Glycine soja]